MRSLGRNNRKRTVVLCMVAALLSMALSACGNGSVETVHPQYSPHKLKITCPTGCSQLEEFDEGADASFQEQSSTLAWEQSDGSGAPKLEELRPIFQNPKYPNGCEIASLAAVLQYYGFDVKLDELNKTYLPRQDFSYAKQGALIGPDPEKYYVGDPASNQGWYCFEHPLATAADAYLDNHDSDLCARILTGASMDELEAWIENNVPVIVWFTVNYGAPAYSSSFHWTLGTGEQYIPYCNLHCLVLTAIEGNVCRLADSLAGITEVDSDTFEEIYAQMGQRALVIAPMEEA